MKMAEQEKYREAFADQSLRYLVHFGFDGLDLDWEYPTMVTGDHELNSLWLKSRCLSLVA